MKKVKLLMLFTLLAALFRHQLRQEEHGRAAGEHRRHDIGQRLGKHNGCCPENRRQDEHEFRAVKAERGGHCRTWSWSFAPNLLCNSMQGCGGKVLPLSRTMGSILPAEAPFREEGVKQGGNTEGLSSVLAVAKYRPLQERRIFCSLFPAVTHKTYLYM